MVKINKIYFEIVINQNAKNNTKIDRIRGSRKGIWRVAIIDGSGQTDTRSRRFVDIGVGRFRFAGSLVNVKIL